MFRHGAQVRHIVQVLSHLGKGLRAPTVLTILAAVVGSTCGGELEILTPFSKRALDASGQACGPQLMTMTEGATCLRIHDGSAERNPASLGSETTRMNDRDLKGARAGEEDVLEGRLTDAGVDAHGHEHGSGARACFHARFCFLDFYVELASMADDFEEHAEGVGLGGGWIGRWPARAAFRSRGM